MTPKQADRLRKKITDIRRVLAAEKRKFGWHDDSRGLRYFPTKYHIQLGDVVGGLTYTRWFAKNFPDDAGFPEFLFEWLVILFKNGKIKEAEQKAIETFCADIHLLNSFLGRPPAVSELWEDEPRTDSISAEYFGSLSTQVSLTDYAEWLTEFVATDRFLSSTGKYIDLRRQLQGEHDLVQRRHLVAQLGAIAHPTG